jgi:hypothetical protein
MTQKLSIAQLALLILITLFIPGLLFSQDSITNEKSTDKEINLSMAGNYMTLKPSQFSKLPFRSIMSYGLLTPSAYRLKDNEIYYYGIPVSNNNSVIDGMQIADMSNLPPSVIQSYDIYTKESPINIGFASGGITSIESKSGPQDFKVLFDINTDQAFNKQGYNGQAFIFIPLASAEKRKKNSISLPSLLIAGKYVWTNNNNPVWEESQKLNSKKLNWLSNNPLRPTDYGSGTYSNSSYVLPTDMIAEGVPENSGKNGVYPFIKLDVPISKGINLSIGNISSIDESVIYNRYNKIFNARNNSVKTRRNFDNYLNFEQEFELSAEMKASYNINLQYSNYHTKIANPAHDDNFFDYGYVGKFTSYKTPTYELGSDTVDGQYYENVWVLNSWDYDTLVSFKPSQINGDLSAYTSSYYDIYSDAPDHFQNIDEIVLGGGVINGSQPNSVYNLQNNLGSTSATYQENNNEKFRTAFNLKLDYKNHHLIMGGEYNIETNSYYTFSPNRLWSLMRGLTNFHLRELDKENPVIVSYNGHVDTILYYRKYDGNSQREFDKKLRESLGLPENGLDFILIDSYDYENNTINYYDKDGKMHEINTPPNFLSMDMFTSEELYSDGMGTLSYAGYDYMGSKIKSNSDPYSFFRDNTVSAIKTKYWAAFIEDDFTWKNLHVRLGLRVEVYDANQPVLRDEYSLYEINNVAYAEQLGELEFSIPGSIEGDYSVYVDKMNDPTRVVGYRNNHQWYNSDGVEISSPFELDVGNGISPYLKYPDITSMQGEWEPGMTFMDYEKVVNLLPRIHIDYTLFKRMNLYCSYSSSTQNPYNSDFRPDQYYYINYFNRSILSNPALKPMRTGKLFVGIKGSLWNNILLKASYLSTYVDNFIYPKRVDFAYPVSYLTFDNDHNTITTQGYELSANVINSGSSGLSGGINYTRLYPDEMDLASFYTSDKVLNANIGYSFGRGDTYKGPGWLNAGILSGISTCLYYQHRSGTQYYENGNGFEKTPNYNMFNINVQKEFVIGKKSILNVYMVVENLLNFKNVFEVYRKTGLPDDDGFLSDPDNERLINDQLNPESYRLLYQLHLYNPQHYDIPRIWRFGLTFRY